VSAGLLADSLLERNGALFQIIAGFLIAIVTSAITWYLTVRQKAAKTFDYRVQDVPIAIPPLFATELLMNLERSGIQHPRIVNVQFANSGSEVIRSSEILEPYALKIDTKPISVASVESSRADLAIVSTVEPVPGEPDWYRVPLLLKTMNPGDGFTLQLIVDSEKPVNTTLSGCAEKQTRPPGWYTTEPHMGALTSEIRWATLGSVASIGAGISNLLMAHGDVWNLIVGACFTVVGVATGVAMLGARAERKSRKKGSPSWQN
jgi:hypothetical protein